MRGSSRFVVLGLMVAVLLTATGGSQVAAQAGVCLNANVDYFLKIDDVRGESSAVSVEERCGDGNFAIAITVSPATETEIRTSPDPESVIVGIIVIGP